MSKNAAIGIFDSGIGGLTVLHSIKCQLPHEGTVYLGDTARVPYGTKSAGIVTQYAMEIALFLSGMDVKALVVACNTASAVALPKLRESFDLPIIGMIDPAAAKAAAVTKNGRVGILGTEGTVRSGAYEKAVKGFDDGLTVISKACPLFVPLAEEGWVDNDVAMLTAEKYVASFREEGVDTLILGCTHYPLFKETLKKVVGSDVALVDSGEEAARELRVILDDAGALAPAGTPQRSYFVTDTPDRFLRIGERFFGEPLGDVAHVDIP